MLSNSLCFGEKTWNEWKTVDDMKDKQLHVYINETWILQDSINTNFTDVNARFICYTYLALILSNFYYFSE